MGRLSKYRQLDTFPDHIFGDHPKNREWVRRRRSTAVWVSFGRLRQRIRVGKNKKARDRERRRLFSGRTPTDCGARTCRGLFLFKKRRVKPTYFTTVLFLPTILLVFRGLTVTFYCFHSDHPLGIPNTSIVPQAVGQ